MLTNERLKELSGMKIIEAADKICPKEIKEAVEELLAIREAGDEENTRLEQDLARLKVEYADLKSRFDATNEACDIFEKNSKAAADLCDENWKLKAEIERLKSRKIECCTCGHEMAEVDGQFGCENCDHEYDGTCDCWQCNHSREHESMKSQIDSLAAELTALKSAPGMEEIDALVEEWTGADAGVVQKIIRIARRSIAARSGGTAEVSIPESRTQG